MTACPDWVEALMAQARADVWTGELRIIYHSGHIKHAKRMDLVLPPDARNGGLRRVACPNGCGPMQAHDVGTLYLCPKCGTKRTLAQVKAL